MGRPRLCFCGTCNNCKRWASRRSSLFCERCGKALPPGYLRFCSRRCSRSPERTCVICGSFFRNKNPRIQTCGRGCGNKLAGLTRTANARKYGPCRICGAYWSTKFGNRRYCSRACYVKGRRLDSIGVPKTLSNGYVAMRLADDDALYSMADARGYVSEHRLVMARHLGRPLQRYEQVHHLNGDRADNRLTNLQLRSGPHGSGQSARCADCGSRHIVFERI